mmetsp:Transcript_5930/g.14190  ORF Transcript_5930/g.14190 Transcript_5930/m.14190 type:complete len:226 (-) Transcript_5930:2753-3430(-)
MHCSRGSHECPRLLPSARPMDNRVLMHSMFFPLISFNVVRYVNFAKELTKDSNSTGMSNLEAILTQCLKPSRHPSTVKESSCVSSSTLNVANSGQHATSKRNLTYSTVSAVATMYGDSFFFSFFLISSVDRVTIPRVSLRNNSNFLRPAAVMDSIRAFAPWSSGNSHSSDTTRSYSVSRYSLGRSCESLMPRLLRMKSSLVILFSGRICELCASVCNMIRENEST